MYQHWVGILANYVSEERYEEYKQIISRKISQRNCEMLCRETNYWLHLKETGQNVIKNLSFQHSDHLWESSN